MLDWSKSEHAEWAKDRSGFYLLTGDGAARCQIVAVDLDHPGRSPWHELVPECGGTLLEAHFFGEAGKPTAKPIAQAADRLAFLDRAPGLTAQ